MKTLQYKLSKLKHGEKRILKKKLKETTKQGGIDVTELQEIKEYSKKYLKI